MRPNARIPSIILFFSFLVVPTDVALACEDKIVALGGLLLATNTGDEQPAPVLVGQRDTYCEWGNVELAGLFSPIDKKVTEAGFFVSGNFIVRRRLSDSLFITGGASVNYRDAGQFVKKSVHPKAGLAWLDRRQLIEVLWNFREYQTANRVEGAELRFRRDFYPTERSFGVRIEYRAFVSRFSLTGPNNIRLGRDTAVSTRILVGIVCCRRDEAR